MNVEFTCGDPAGLAGYLYDECEKGERAAIEAHLAICASCASELSALGATRTALASWTPPEATLGFRIADAREPRWWARPLPAWAQAAAALVIFAVGMALGMRAVGQPPAAAPVRASVAAPSAPAAGVSTTDLAALERRLRAEMAALRSAGTSPAAAVRVPAQSAANDDAVIQRVRALLAESEERQQRELAVRLSQVLRDVDTQRRMDLRRIEQTFGQMEGLTRPELADQRQMINYLFQRTGTQRSPQQ